MSLTARPKANEILGAPASRPLKSTFFLPAFFLYLFALQTLYTTCIRYLMLWDAFAILAVMVCYTVAHSLLEERRRSDCPALSVAGYMARIWLVSLSRSFTF